MRPPAPSSPAQRLRELLLCYVLPIIAAGALIAAWRGLLWPGGSDVPREYGAVRVAIRPPAAGSRQPEPVIVCGKPGRAALVYVRFLPGERAKVGLQFVGVGAWESGEFAVAPDSNLEITCALPVFFPPEGDAAWGGTPTARQRARRSEYEITAGGVSRLRWPTDYALPADSPISIGRNLVGGDLVASAFTGTVVTHGRQPFPP